MLDFLLVSLAATAFVFGLNVLWYHPKVAGGTWKNLGGKMPKAKNQLWMMARLSVAQYVAVVGIWTLIQLLPVVIWADVVVVVSFLWFALVSPVSFVQQQCITEKWKLWIFDNLTGWVTWLVAAFIIWYWPW